MNTIGIISANYVSGDFGELAKRRTLASLPIGGRYRLIDFALSNMANSGITTVGVIAPYNSGSLIDHIGVGKPWSMDKKVGGMFVMPGSVFGVTMTGNRFLMRDIIANRQFVSRDGADYVIICGSSDVYNMDYRPLIEAHAASGNPITAVVKDVDDAQSRRGFFMVTDQDGKVTEMSTRAVRTGLYFMDCFVVDRSFLLDFIDWFASLEYLDFMDIIAMNLDKFSVGTYTFEGYLGKVSCLEDYWHVSGDLLKSEVINELFNQDRTIKTKVQDEPPTVFRPGSNVKDSLIAAGCEIEGTVEHSIIFRATHVGKGAVIRDSIVMQHGEIGENAEIERVIMDKNVTVNPGVKACGSQATPIVLGKGKTI